MNEATQKMTEAERNRWFSTGFLASGVKTVNAEKHQLEDAAVIRVGEAKGHRLWIDSEFCTAVQASANDIGEKGLKARFGHPDMCSDALGTFLGRWKGLAAGADGVVRGVLHLSSTAAESPKGDLRNYVEQMAAKEPEHFGTSIVFSRDWEKEDEFAENNMEEVDETDENGVDPGKPTGNKLRRFRSPDPLNVENLRHARLSALHAADLVDDPAATDGMFAGATGTALAAKVSEWLDTHPEILNAFSDQPEMVSIIERYSSQLRPFIDRYVSNRKPDAELSGEAAAEKQKAAETAQAMTAHVTELEAKVQAMTEEKKALEEKIVVVFRETEGLVTERGVLSARLSAANKVAEQLTAEVKTLTERAVKSERERDEACAKLAAIEKGADPVSSNPAENVRGGGNMWDDARKSGKKG